MSFVMLTESQLHPPPATSTVGTNGAGKGSNPSAISTGAPEGSIEELSKKFESSMRLFEILSSRSDIDHPICSECADILLASLQDKLAAANRERDAYISFLKELKSNVPTPAEVAKAEAELAASRAEQEKAFAELLELEKQKASLVDEIAELDAESRALDEEEEEFWRERNLFSLELSAFQATRDALNAAYEHDAQQLERLQRTNVYNDTFCIGHDGNFGTINGLRLGRLAPPNNTEWTEINAAWGATAHLLATVADRLGFTFRGYKIKPMGSTSHVEKIEYPQTHSTSNSVLTTRTSSTTPSTPNARTQAPKITLLELYSSGDIPLGRTILHRRFNEAMVAFLDCLRQLAQFVEHGQGQGQGQQAGGLKLPYPIEKDKIGDISIKLGVSQDEQWTTACKYTLTVCKYLLAHASNVGGGGGGTRRNVG
jgi:beclin 1